MTVFKRPSGPIKWRGLVYLGLLLLAAFSVEYSVRLLRAASVLYSFSIKQAPLPVRAYDHVMGRRSSLSDISIPGTNGPVDVRIYTPSNCKTCPTIVMVHGFAPEGNKDNGLNLFARRLARVGFRVVLPTVPAEMIYQMKTSDLVVIGDTIRWSAQTFGERVSVVGISFGGGMVIPASAQTSVAGDVKLIFCLSGYNDLDKIGRYYLHDRIDDPEGHPYLGQGPPTGPLIVVSQYLDEMVPASDIAALRGPLNRFEELTGTRLSPSDPSLASLSRSQLKTFEELQTVTTEDMRRKYLNVLTRHHDEIYALSPASVLSNLTIPLYVLHGRDDQTIPAGEVEWMKQETAGKQDVHIFITPWMAHASIGQRASLLEKLRVGVYFAGLLEEASRRS